MDLRVARWKQILYYRRIKRLKDDFIDGVRPAEEVLDEIHALCGRGCFSFATLPGDGTIGG